MSVISGETGCGKTTQVRSKVHPHKVLVLVISFSFSLPGAL